MDELLQAWFAEHGRDLPWRRTRDPYAILVSEVMLQQTQVERVIPRWRAWLERWPDARRARRRLARGRDPRVARARLQPARAEPTPGGAGGRARRLAGRPDRAPGRRAIHRRRDPQPGLRRGRAPGRHERRADPGTHRARVRPGRAAGALRPRRHDLPRTRAALRDLPAGRGVPVARQSLRAAAEAVALRGLVPATPGGAAQARRRGAAAGRARSTHEAVESLVRDGLVERSTAGSSRCLPRPGGASRRWARRRRPVALPVDLDRHERARDDVRRRSSGKRIFVQLSQSATGAPYHHRARRDPRPAPRPTRSWTRSHGSKFAVLAPPRRRTARSGSADSAPSGSGGPARRAPRARARRPPSASRRASSC